MSRSLRTSSIAALVALACSTASQQPTCRTPVPFTPSTVKVGTGGSWQDGARYGRFRYFVFAHGSEHTTHTVEIEIQELVPRDDPDGRVDTRVIGCVATGPLTEPYIWWVDSIAIDAADDQRSLLRMKLAYAENPDVRRDHVLELSRDGRLRIVTEAFPNPVSAAPEFATPPDTGCDGHRECLRAAEPQALARRTDVRRDSLHLVFSTGSGGSVSLEDGQLGQEDRHYYLYNGWDGSLRAHRVYLLEYESSAVLYVFPTSGAIVGLDDLPTISPSGRFLATASWDTEAGYMPNRAQIFRVQPDTLVLEWAFSPEGWGPDSLTWENDSTLIISRGAALGHPDPASLRTPLRVWRAGGSWHADSSRRTP